MIVTAGKSKVCDRHGACVGWHSFAQLRLQGLQEVGSALFVPSKTGLKPRGFSHLSTSCIQNPDPVGSRAWSGRLTPDNRCKVV